MKTAIKILLLLTLAGCRNADGNSILALNGSAETAPGMDFGALREKSREAESYCKSKGLNREFYILVDLKKHSGKKRFYVWDFKNDTISDAFLVSHGCAENPWGMDLSKENATVSNVDGSHASSVGKYIIGKRGYSNWGIHVNYRLHGQDATNSNAAKRQIVLHSWEKVTDDEVYPNGTPEGWGCPALSNNAMRAVDAQLKAAKKRTLLWVVQ